MKTNSKRFSLEKVPLSSLQCQILRILLKEDYPFNQFGLVKETKSTTGGISKALTGLHEYGLIAELKQSTKAYIINPFRKEEIEKFLTGVQLGKNKPLVLSGHAFIYEAELNDLTDRLVKSLKKDPTFIGFHPNGWKYAYKSALIDGSYRLQKTKNGAKLIAYFRTFGPNPAIIEMVNNEKFLNLKNELENKYMGLKIGNVEQIASCPWQEYALLKDPIAEAGISLGIKHKDVKQIEKSYGYPEWEEKGYNARDKIQRVIELRHKEVELLNS